MIYFLKGILIGLVFGIPIGAVGALTVRRTIAYGRMAGFISGLGCSAADLCYSCISIFGFTLISDFLLAYQNIISFSGGALLIVMGIGFISKKQSKMCESAAGAKLVSIFASSFMIAITNPATIITFLMAFSIFNIGEIHSIYNGAGTIIGILSGTCIWWALISLIIGNVRKRTTNRILAIINIILGVLVLFFGAAVLIKSIYSF